MAEAIHAEVIPTLKEMKANPAIGGMPGIIPRTLIIPIAKAEREIKASAKIETITNLAVLFNLLSLVAAGFGSLPFIISDIPKTVIT